MPLEMVSKRKWTATRFVRAVAMRSLRLLLVSLLLAGCVTPIGGGMRQVAGPLSLSAPPNAARVVFVRPWSFVGPGFSPFIVDGRRKIVLGQSFNESAFAVDLAPGSYELCAAPIVKTKGSDFYPVPSEATARATLVNPVTRLDAVEGSTYLIRVAFSLGLRTSMELEPVRPGTRREHEVQAELVQARPMELEPRDATYRAAESAGQVSEWFELCRNASDEATRLRLDAEDGR